MMMHEVVVSSASFDGLPRWVGQPGVFLATNVYSKFHRWHITLLVSYALTVSG
jgi:hypothetical protein